MSDARKTKQQLIDELSAARERITALVADAKAREVLPLADGKDASTERAQLSQKLQEQARSLEHIVSSARCLLWVGEVEEIDGAYVWSFEPLSAEAAEKLLPLDVKEGDDWSLVLAAARLPEDDAKMNATGAAALRSGTSSYSQDYRAVDRHGEMRWLHEDVSLEVVGPGRWGAIGVTTDITDRKRAEEELRESQARYRKTAEVNQRFLGVMEETAARRPH